MALTGPRAVIVVSSERRSPVVQSASGHHAHRRPKCSRSFTLLFVSRLVMRATHCHVNRESFPSSHDYLNRFPFPQLLPLPKSPPTVPKKTTRPPPSIARPLTVAIKDTLYFPSPHSIIVLLILRSFLHHLLIGRCDTIPHPSTTTSFTHPIPD